MTNSENQEKTKKIVKEILQKDPRLKLLGLGVETNKDITVDGGAIMAFIGLNGYALIRESTPFIGELAGDCKDYLYFFVEGTTKLNNRIFVIPDYLREFSTEHTALQHRTIQL